MSTTVHQVFGRAGLALAVAVAALFSSVASAETVDLLLALAADVSRSVDAQKFQLQREGYAAAITNPRVVEAIGAGGPDASRSVTSNGRGREIRRSSSTGW